MSFINELKRRNVIRVAVAYAVIAWLLLQVSDVLVNALELPATLSKLVIALLLIGFVPVLVFAWVYEMTPEGLKKESEVAPGQSVTTHTARKLDLVVIVLLVLAIGLFAADRFLLRAPLPADSGEVRAESAGQVVPAIPVVAVLPLNALSDDQEGTFLASGLHDDLLTKLARLQAFKVISRTSVMEYQGTTKNLRQIGQELGAGFIVEGGLQSIGGRVSINAQLIDAHTDQHLWAETFNRELTTANLFDVQAEIAGAIANALHTALSPSDIQTLEAVPTGNLAAYRAYLRGLESDNLLGNADMLTTIAAHTEAVKLDPEFSEAWAALSRALMRRYWEEGGEDALAPDPALREQARDALQRAEALDPDSVQTRLAHAWYRYYGFRDYAGALLELGEAAAVAPHDPDVITTRAYLLRRLGRLDEAADALLRALELNRNPGDVREAFLTLRLARRCTEARAELDRALQDYPGDHGIALSGAWVLLQCDGDVAGGRELLDSISVTTLEQFSNTVTFLEYQRDYAAAIERCHETLAAIGPDGDQAAGLMVNAELAWLYHQTGQAALAESARADAIAAAEGLPDNGSVLQLKALVAALSGQREQAVALVRRAMADRPEDAFARPWYEFYSAAVFAVAGAREEALAQLESAVAIARGEEMLQLRMNPYFDSIREEPRFQALLAAVEDH